MSTPNPVITARNNLARRIARFIANLEAGGRAPSRLEGNHVAAAIGCLREDLCGQGETMMLYAEKEWRLELVNPTGETMTARRLRELLAEATGELGP